MTDGPMYWSSNDQAGWYQSQPVTDQSMTQAPVPHQQHQNSYQTNTYHQMHAGGPPQQQQQQQQQQQRHPIPADHTSPGPQIVMNESTPNGVHHNTHMQSNVPPQAPHTNHPTVNNYNQQHHMPNSNSNNVMHDSTNQQQQQQQPMTVPPIPTHPVPPHQQHMQNIDSTQTGYSYAQQSSQNQMYPQQSSTSPNNNYSQPNTNSVPHNQHNTGGLNHGPSPISSMHQQSPVQQNQQPTSASVYPPEQYSPAPYWNPAPPHHQSSYGQPGPPPPPPQASPMMHQQNAVPTPPMTDNSTMYPMSNGVMPGPPQQAQVPPPPPPTQNPNMPYDNRGPNYGSPYPVQTNYYGAHEQPNPYDTSSQHHMSASHHHQQQAPPPSMQNHQHQSNWSNGYYQQNSHYPPRTNHYSPMPPAYNGSSTGHTPNHNQAPPPPPPPMHSGAMQSNHHNQIHHQPQQQQSLNNHLNGPPMPQHNHYGVMQQGQPLAPNYGSHPQQQQRWPPPNQMQPNHAMPISDRKIKSGQEKKPVKPRAPRQKNPNATSGRRKDPKMSKEQKLSGYAEFYKIKHKELASSMSADNKDFGVYSKMIADLWAQLSEEEKASYAIDVKNRQKEMLRKKASQQAQDLVQAIL